MKLTKSRFLKRTCAICLIAVGTVASSTGQVFTTLVQFDGTNGGQPTASLVQGADGYLYGTTTIGGDLTCDAGEGCGTVFRLSLKDGSLTTLHAFGGQDGMFPWSALVLGTDGYFYGTTAAGGDLTCMASEGCGTIFKMTPQGELTTLHEFENENGTSPIASLKQGIDGNFYGTASVGGINNCIPLSGCGTVFKISPDGTFQTLYSFDGTDGAAPNAALIQALDGEFYGTTMLGGSYDCDNTYGCGTAFKMSPQGALSVLHQFDLTDGSQPAAAFLKGPNDELYTTSAGGGRYNLGTIFRSSRSGAITVLHQFQGGDGALPYAPLIVGTDGNVYGTAYYGGSYGCFAPHGCGTVFMVTRQGKLTKVHRFNGKDGNAPYAALFQAANGIFYGTTSQGANQSCFLGGCGTVFSLDMSQNPYAAHQH